MSYDKFFEELTGAVEGIRKLVGDAVDEFYFQAMEKDKDQPGKPVAPQAKNRMESELDNSLSEQVPHQEKPKDEPVVGAYGTDKAFEDLKTYYEGRLQQAESDAQKVSQQHQDFVAEVASELGIKGDLSRSERAILGRARQIRNHVLGNVTRADEFLEMALENWENL